MNEKLLLSFSLFIVYNILFLRLHLLLFLSLTKRDFCSFHHTRDESHMKIVDYYHNFVLFWFWATWLIRLLCFSVISHKKMNGKYFVWPVIALIHLQPIKNVSDVLNSKIKRFWRRISWIFGHSINFNSNQEILAIVIVWFARYDILSHNSFQCPYNLTKLQFSFGFV